MFSGAHDGTPTFLSIDMDFFGTRGEWDIRIDEAQECLDNLVKLCRRQSIPLTAVMNHHQMLTAVDESQARRLVNYDAHSDLADVAIDVFSCGTWVSFVKWRKDGEYIWMRSDSELYSGECGYCFGCGCNDRLTDWSKTRTRQTHTAPSFHSLRKMSVVHACVCMSPDFSKEELVWMFRDWIRDNNIPYTKGRLNEEKFKCDRKPPGAMRYEFA